jgi:hypothetical protein
MKAAANHSMTFTRPVLVGFLLSIGIVACLVMVIFERHLGQQSKNYTLIEPGLFMGGDELEPPAGTRAVLNLCEAKDPYQCDVHVWEPIPDRAPAPDLDWLRRMVDFVDEQRKAGRTVYVHCRNGVSRSGMVVTAYLMFKKSLSRDEALQLIRTKRPEVRPNPAFMELLLDWEQVLRKAA